MRALAAQAVYDSAQRNFLPALYVRADRCAPEDVKALARFHRPASLPVGRVRASVVLNLLVNRSEIFDDSLFQPNPSSLVAAAGVTYWRNVWDAIPGYAHDAFWGAWARTDASVLVLQAEIDAQTPRANGQAARQRLGARTIHHVSFPWLNHNVSAEWTCGQAVIRSFLADPRAAPDVACRSRLPLPSFAVMSADAMARFGEPDL